MQTWFNIHINVSNFVTGFPHDHEPPNPPAAPVVARSNLFPRERYKARYKKLRYSGMYGTKKGKNKQTKKQINVLFLELIHFYLPRNKCSSSHNSDNGHFCDPSDTLSNKITSFYGHWLSSHCTNCLTFIPFG